MPLLTDSEIIARLLTKCESIDIAGTKATQYYIACIENDEPMVASLTHNLRDGFVQLALVLGVAKAAELTETPDEELIKLETVGAEFSRLEEYCANAPTSKPEGCCGICEKPGGLSDNQDIADAINRFLSEAKRILENADVEVRVTDDDSGELDNHDNANL